MGVSWNFYFLTNLERFVLTDNDKFYGRTLVQHLGVLLFRHIFDFAHPCKERKYADRAYNWHSAGSLGWPFPMLKCKYIFQIKYTEAFYQFYQTALENCYGLKLPKC